jgi:hypothetical protein
MQGKLSSHDMAALGRTVHSAFTDINIAERAEWLLRRVNNVLCFWLRAAKRNGYRPQCPGHGYPTCGPRRFSYAAQPRL